MSKIDCLAGALSEWGYDVAKAILPKYTIPMDSPVGKFMYGILGVNPASYNVWSELGFLAEPVLQSVITPMVSRLAEGMPEEQIPAIAEKFVDSFIARAREKGSVNLFGMEMGEDAFLSLKKTMERRFKEDK
jgi:hypothetical protein